MTTNAKGARGVAFPFEETEMEIEFEFQLHKNHWRKVSPQNVLVALGEMETCVHCQW